LLSSSLSALSLSSLSSSPSHGVVFNIIVIVVVISIIYAVTVIVMLLCCCRCWSTETGQCLKIFRGHTDTVTCVIVCNGILASGAKDKSCKGNWLLILLWWGEWKWRWWFVTRHIYYNILALWAKKRSCKVTFVMVRRREDSEAISDKLWQWWIIKT
jgi:hypothetical protein